MEFFFQNSLFSRLLWITYSHVNVESKSDKIVLEYNSYFKISFALIFFFLIKAKSRLFQNYLENVFFFFLIQLSCVVHSNAPFDFSHFCMVKVRLINVRCTSRKKHCSNNERENSIIHNGWLVYTNKKRNKKKNGFFSFAKYITRSRPRLSIVNVNVSCGCVKLPVEWARFPGISSIGTIIHPLGYLVSPLRIWEECFAYTF